MTNIFGLILLICFSRSIILTNKNYNFYIFKLKDFADNYLGAISKNFTLGQVRMLRRPTIKSFNANSFLILSLDLPSPLEIVSLNMYNAVKRFILLSFETRIKSVTNLIFLSPFHLSIPQPVGIFGS